MKKLMMLLLAGCLALAVGCGDQPDYICCYAGTAYGCDTESDKNACEGGEGGDAATCEHRPISEDECD